MADLKKKEVSGMEQLQRDDKRVDKTKTVEDRGREQETAGIGRPGGGSFACSSLYVPLLLASFIASPLHCQLFPHLATSPYLCFLFSASVFYCFGFIHPFVISLQLFHSTHFFFF